MIFKNKITQKFISSLIIFTMLVPALFVSFSPKKADAIWGFGDIVWDPAHMAVSIKNVATDILKEVLMVIARKLLNKITQSTINWINSGFHGNPLYLENSESFFKDIVKFEVKTFIDTIGYNRLKMPFGKDFALNVMGSYQRQFEDNAQYTLSKVINDAAFLERYRNDFNVGGWNGFLINTQYPQNNYIGYQMLATEELARRLANNPVSNNIQKVQDTLQKGAGFLSPQTCPSNPRYNNGKNEFLQQTWDEEEYEKTQPPPLDQTAPGYAQDYIRWEAFRDQAKQGWIADNTCPGGLVSTTPGSVVGDQIKQALSSSGRRGELAQALGNSVAAILDTLINHFIDKGLNALTNRGSSSGLSSGGEGFNTDFLNSPDMTQVANDFTGSINTLTDQYGETIADSGNLQFNVSGSGGQCADTGNQYAGTLRQAMNAVDPSIASLQNTEVDINGRGYKINGRIFLDAVAIIINNMGSGWRARSDVLNGNNNTSTGDIIAVWKDGDTFMERYDALTGSSSLTVGGAAQTGFEGFIPLDCYEGGGGTDCGCRSTTTTIGVGTTGGTTTPPTGGGTTTPGSPSISSVSPTSVAAGGTLLINGSNLSRFNDPSTSTVRFFNSVGTPDTYIFPLNSSETQVTVTIPTSFPAGSYTLEVVKSGTQISNRVALTVTGALTPIPVLAQKSLGGGTFPDVAFYNNRIWLAVQHGLNVLSLYNWALDLTDQRVQQITYVGHLAFPRLTVYNNILWLAFRWDDDPLFGVNLWRSDTGTIEELGGGVGNDPVALQNGFVAWQKFQPDGTLKVVRRPLMGGTTVVVRDFLPTGISRILANGSVVMIDEDRLAVAGYTRPWVTGGLTIAEGNGITNSGLFGFWNNSSSPFTITGSPFSVFGTQESFAPHAATDGTLYAVASWGNVVGVRIAVIQK